MIFLFIVNEYGVKIQKKGILAIGTFYMIYNTQGSYFKP
jgi:hypothetical protein